MSDQRACTIHRRNIHCVSKKSLPSSITELTKAPAILPNNISTRKQNLLLDVINDRVLYVEKRRILEE